MAGNPFHTKESFARVIEALIDDVDAKNRGDDLDRLVKHVVDGPQEVTNLAGLLFLIDEDFRTALQQELEAHRRWLKKKDAPCDDHTLFEALMAIYRNKRGLDA